MSTTERRTDGYDRQMNGDFDRPLSSRSSRELQRDIEHTRHQMDETLEQIGERLHPKHLLDEILDFFRSSDSSSEKRDRYLSQARSSGKQVVRKIRQHPVPALLCGAGIAWLVYEELAQEDNEDIRRRMHSQWADIPEHSGSFVDARTGEPYDEEYGEQWKGVAPWSDDYEWSEEDEKTWSARATAALSDIKSRLSDSGLTARDKIQHVGSRLMGLSGRKRRDLNKQFDTLARRSPPSSGLGAPYGEASSGTSFERDLHNLCACDFVASHDWSDEDEESWTEKAQHMIEELQSSLSSASGSAKDQLRMIAGHVGDFVGSTRDMSSHYGSRLWQQGARLGRSSRRAASSMQHQMRDGYSMGRERFSSALEESPFAVGAAALGLGLIAGLLLPSTPQEDALMGDASDNLKDQVKGQVKDTSKDVMRRGQHVAEATMQVAKDELEKEGLSPQQLGEKVKHVAQATASTARDETKHEAQSLKTDTKRNFDQSQFCSTESDDQASF